jgi:hypothetical protein
MFKIKIREMENGMVASNNYNCDQFLVSKENVNIIPWFHSILV